MSTLLVVEDGTGLAAANTFIRPREAAEVLATRGFITAEASNVVANCTVAAAGRTVTRASGDWQTFVQRFDIIRIEGAVGAGNNGFDYVDSISSTVLTLGGWLDLADEAGVTLTVTAYLQSGWWASPREALEATLVQGSEWLGSKYGWLGEPLKATPGLSFPRKGLYVGAGSRYYAPGTLLPSDEVPVAVRRAAALAAAESRTRSLLETTDVGQLVKRKTLGPITKEFFAPGAPRQLAHVNRELYGLYRVAHGARRLQAV